MAKTPKHTSAAAKEAVLVDGRAAYIVANNAPQRVAGRRVAPGETLMLTASEARAELLALHISPVNDPASEPASKDD